MGGETLGDLVVGADRDVVYVGGLTALSTGVYTGMGLYCNKHPQNLSSSIIIFYTRISRVGHI